MHQEPARRPLAAADGSMWVSMLFTCTQGTPRSCSLIVTRMNDNTVKPASARILFICRCVTATDQGNTTYRALLRDTRASMTLWYQFEADSAHT